MVPGRSAPIRRRGPIEVTIAGRTDISAVTSEATTNCLTQRWPEPIQTLPVHVSLVCVSGRPDMRTFQSRVFGRRQHYAFRAARAQAAGAAVRFPTVHAVGGLASLKAGGAPLGA